MNLKIGQKVIHKTDMQEGTVIEVIDNVAKVIFNNGEIKHMHSALLAEKLDGSVNDDRSFLTE